MVAGSPCPGQAGNARGIPGSGQEPVRVIGWPGRGILFILVGMPSLPQSRAARWGLLGAGVLLCGMGVDATLVEPNWIEVVHSVEYLPMIRTLAPDRTL